VFPIPKQNIRTWQDSVPKVTIRTTAGDGVRNIRLRFYADPLSRHTMGALDRCDFCGEFLISYIPPKATFTLDGSDETITVTVLSAQSKTVVKNATSLVMNSDGGPFDWPLITCGYAYMLAVDIAHGDGPPNWMSLSMTPRGI
jgi:hypothetical protein